MNEQTQRFIRENANKDIRTLALSGSKYPDVDMPFALDQIAGRQTARKKIPRWAAIDDVVYPPHLSMEQCSSEQTALYKASMVEGETLVDLTGGFGVDFSFMSGGFKKSIYVERQRHLCEIADSNFRVLKLTGVDVICGDGVEYLETLDHVSWIYLDPARRNEHGGKTYAISDCMPDVTEIKDLLLAKADKVMVKLSPMLDWRKAVADLGNCVSEVHIVSVDNECKELLLIMQRDVAELKVVCVNNDEVFVFGSSDDTFRSEGVKTLFSEVKEVKEVKTLLSDANNSSTRQLVNLSTAPYLYEPNASIMKAGCFAELERAFGARQVERNSHLFVSEHFIEDFPGRKFRVEKVTTLNKKDIKNALDGIVKANITVRNFPMSVEQLRKRLKIKEGGSDYIFATTLMDKSHVLLLCSRL
ncbi:MAG: SAM-dependent methyltransferase [Prevotella sp.]|nr:SAM-dependent methyltransferase [Prevotella sp.]